MKLQAAVHEGSILKTSDGDFDLQDRKKRFGSTSYLTLNLDFSKLFLTKEDVIHATKSAPIGAKLDCCGKKAHLVDPHESWGAKHLKTLEEVQAFINDATDLLGQYGIEFKPSASGTIATLVQDQVPQMKQLKPRWRQLAIEAIFGGPCAVVAGSCPNAVSIDLSAAYLHGLRLPLSMPDSYVPVGPWDTWEHVQDKDGFIRAIVDVPDLGWRSIGLLPVKAGPKTYFPCGRIVGTWPLSLVRQAVELGASVVQIIEGATYTGYPYLAPLADLLDHLKNHSPLGKTLAKALYTRAWGILSSRGRYEGTIDHLAQDTIRLDHTPTLTFKTTKPIQEDLETHKVHPTYRPDWAAVIATYCTLKMQKATYELQGALIATHVDSIAFTLDETTQPLLDQYLADGWHHVEGPAEARWYGVGLAVHGTRILHKGIPGTPTPEEVEEYAFAHPDPQDGFRWLERYTKEARARPTRFSLSTPSLFEAGLTTFDNKIRTSIWSDKWSKSGWRKDWWKGHLLGPQPQDWLDIVQRLAPSLPEELDIVHRLSPKVAPPEAFDIETFLEEFEVKKKAQYEKEQTSRKIEETTPLPPDFLDSLEEPTLIPDVDYLNIVLKQDGPHPAYYYLEASAQAFDKGVIDDIIGSPFWILYQKALREEPARNRAHEQEWEAFKREFLDEDNTIPEYFPGNFHLTTRSAVSILELEQPMENPYNGPNFVHGHRSTPERDLFDESFDSADMATGF